MLLPYQRFQGMLEMFSELVAAETSIWAAQKLQCEFKLGHKFAVGCCSLGEGVVVCCLKSGSSQYRNY